jgi:hypothetical protein
MAQATGQPLAGMCPPSRETGMKTTIRLMTGVFVALLSSTAFAFHCPQEMKKIDDALAKNPPLSMQQLAEVKEHRINGEVYHKAGEHQKSLDTLEKAKKILGIE